MAGTLVRRKRTSPAKSDQRAVLVAVNNLITDVETLRAAIQTIAAQLDTDAGVTGTNFAANAAVSTASVLVAAKIGNHAGTAYTD